ncbi:MAG: hypothetical protein NQU46_06105 [Methanolinea sp.]|nr:hypothetical protein [Methanolinea sp.]
MPVFSVNDDNCPVPVELNVPYDEEKKFIDPSSRIPHEHKEGPVPWFFTGIDNFRDVFPSYELIDREVAPWSFDRDILEEPFLFLR